MTTARLAVILAFTTGITTISLNVLTPPAPPPPNLARRIAPPQAADEPPGLALSILRGSDRFVSARVGPTGMISKEGLAWRVLFESPARDSLFKALLASDSRPAQLYALAGLFLTDHDAYVRGAAHQRAEGGDVATLYGCIGGRGAVTDILREMDGGMWTRQFLGAVDRYRVIRRGLLPN